MRMKWHGKWLVKLTISAKLVGYNDLRSIGLSFNGIDTDYFKLNIR